MCSVCIRQLSVNLVLSHLTILNTSTVYTYDIYFIAHYVIINIDRLCSLTLIYSIQDCLPQTENRYTLFIGHPTAVNGGQRGSTVVSNQNNRTS